MKRIFVLFSFSILFLLLGCTQAAPDIASGQSQEQLQQAALKECKELCNDSLVRSDIPWPAGPCLGNPLQGNSDFVCDIAHNPRAAADDLPENQCSAFPSAAKHFVELDSECNLIKIY